MTTLQICRFLVPSNPILSLTIALCFFNYLLLLSFSNIQNAFCPEHLASEHVRHKRSSGEEIGKDRHWKIRDENQHWLVEMAKYSTFDWETEMERMMEVIPALETRTDKEYSPELHSRIVTGPNDPTRWGQNLTKSPTLPLVTDRTSDELIANEVRKVNEKISTLYKYTNFIERSLLDALAVKVLKDGLLGCKAMSKLEFSRVEPRIKYTFRSVSQWKGELRISETESIPIKQRRFERRKTPPKSSVEKMNYVMIARNNQKPYLDKSFEHAKYEILNILRTHGWYGFPRLIGVCMTSSSGKDILEHHLSGEDGKGPLISNTLRYLISRHEEGTTQLCDSYYASFECERLHSVMRIVNKSKRSALAALRIMMNTANLFAQLESNGAVLYDLIGTDFIIDSNHDVMLTDLSTVKFLPKNEYSEHSHIQRLLSGTICTENHQCAAVSWQANSISHKFGLHCHEVRGYCTSGNRCWGIDSGVHVCVLSRWFFMKLHSAIPTSWSGDDDLSNLIQCASKQNPDERCSWNQLRIGLKDLYQLALREQSKE